MSDVLDFYRQQAQLKISPISWLARLQQQGLNELARLGFPTRHHEEWKYTLIDSFLQHRFTQNESSPLAQESYAADLPVEGYIVSWVNGCWVQSGQYTLPAGVIILPLAQAIEEHPEKIQPYLGQILQQEHGFQALNTAMLHAGIFIYLPAGVSLPQPVILSHMQDKDNQAVFMRHLLVAEAGSSAVVIEDFQGKPERTYFTNTITELHAAANAKLSHYKLQRESRSAYHMGHLAVKQAQGSEVDTHALSLGGKLMRSDISIDLHEPHARCLLNGIYAPGKAQHMDHHTVVNHNVPDCRSEQDYKGILSGDSRAVFNGKVMVAKHAQHTEARQQNKNLLLAANAEIDTKPQLEIFADDVVCSHGATVGQLDEEALFYFAARGIEQDEARRFLVKAFAADNLRMMGTPKLANWLNQLLCQQLG
ncbi:Fe-S cluster assembly protein SufD [Legionella sp. 27cVA30]|uniref:Fe-S cluster assembly protein SufD n=1 Tax=Legionella sp. 27cVA30 TaxID=2905657 RepID=UPI00209E458D|nr:Fe-S cluster assembly protein SufD [Legionella sp. 27cVA30]MCP0913122.1 Fe-S cluster assembly protein SufD [Legionella sp. 27cVA30]